MICPLPAVTLVTVGAPGTVRGEVVGGLVVGVVGGTAVGGGAVGAGAGSGGAECGGAVSGGGEVVGGAVSGGGEVGRGAVGGGAVGEGSGGLVTGGATGTGGGAVPRRNAFEATVDGGAVRDVGGPRGAGGNVGAGAVVGGVACAPGGVDGWGGGRSGEFGLGPGAPRAYLFTSVTVPSGLSTKACGVVVLFTNSNWSFSISWFAPAGTEMEPAALIGDRSTMSRRRACGSSRYAWFDPTATCVTDPAGENTNEDNDDRAVSIPNT
jgi:hypothetical protein